MPEGDTIYRTARALGKALAGRVVTGFETALAKLARLNDDAPLVGRVVEKVEARGKWCLIFFSGDLILVTHMLMSGSWHLYRTGERWQLPRRAMRVAITCGEMQAVGFNVPVAEFHTARSLIRSGSRSGQVPRLGMDVLGADYSVEAGARALKEYGAAHPEAEVAEVLLNQRVIAGLGNVYKSEVAFAADVHPFRKMSTMTEREMERMAEAAQRFLRANVMEGTEAQMVTYSGGRRTTHDVDRNNRLWVYGRRGEECRRCGAAIEMRRQGTGARVTYWCPSCQPWVPAEEQSNDAPRGGRRRLAGVRRKTSC
ncbi:MAG TPA: DNA-formamidopyrimidine glycosylase family protein [Acidobacteriaceae bacterium]|jgi:endonuclease-8|nr:DNA-formamidopyrimidine glycosylase family protein [Acidobacteriaceae bacterium]